MKPAPQITREYIASRRQFHIKQLEELDILDRHLNAIEGTSKGGAPPLPSLDAIEAAPTTFRPKVIPTKRRVLLTIISKAENGLTGRQVLETALANGHKDYEAGNVSPKLSFYKSKGWLDLNNGLWTITKAGWEQLQKR